MAEALRPEGLYAILDLPQRCELDPVVALDAMVEGGAALIQLRSKLGPLAPALVETLGQRCLEHGVPLVINDELELAERGIPGVVAIHLGQGDLGRLGTSLEQRRERRVALRARGLALGISTHDLAQVQDAIDHYEPDYLGFGPVFTTQSKANPDPSVGLEGLAQACSRSRVPIVAIGGIDLGRVAAVARSGASAFAVIGALAHGDPKIIRDCARALRQAFFQLST